MAERSRPLPGTQALGVSVAGCLAGAPFPEPAATRPVPRLWGRSPGSFFKFPSATRRPVWKMRTWRDSVPSAALGASGSEQGTALLQKWRWDPASEEKASPRPPDPGPGPPAVHPSVNASGRLADYLAWRVCRPCDLEPARPHTRAGHRGNYLSCISLFQTLL